MHRDRDYLAWCWKQSDEYLRRERHLQLHPTKTTITSLSDATFFLGASVKPYRRHARNDTMTRFRDYIEDADKALKYGTANLAEMLSQLNSRLGYLSHFDEYKAIDKVLSQAMNVHRYFTFTKRYTKANIKQS